MATFLRTIALALLTCSVVLAADTAKHPAGASPAAGQWVRSTLRGMTLEEKAGQLIWDRIDAQ